MARSHNVWLASVVIHCRKWSEMVAFWKEALHYAHRRERKWDSDDWVLLRDPHGKGPNLAFQRVPDRPPMEYWYHFDLYSPDPRQEVRRLRKLGATMVRPARKGSDFVTLADPDGNPFDVVGTPRSYRFGQRSD